MNIYYYWTTVRASVLLFVLFSAPIILSGILITLDIALNPLIDTGIILLRLAMNSLTRQLLKISKKDITKLSKCDRHKLDIIIKDYNEHIIFNNYI